MVRTKGGSSKGKEVVGAKKRRGGAEGLRIEDQEPQAPDYPSALFVSVEAEKLMEERYAHRKVLNGRVLDVKFFKDFPMMDWFRIQGWTRLLSKKYSVYPNLVRMFYANMVTEEFRGANVLRCYVKGTHFTLTADGINEIFGIRSAATILQNPLTPVAAKCELLGSHARTPEARYLDIDTRLVMLVVAWMIKPVSGHMTTLTDAVAMIVHDIKHGNYANLGKIMVDHMHGVRGLRASNLPYGMWLTPIFQHVGVDLKNELETKLPLHKLCLGEQTMKNMGLEMDEDGIWRRKHGGRLVLAEGGEEDSGEEGNAGERAEHDSQPIPEEMEPGMRTSSSSGYPSYTARFDTLEEEVRSIRRSQDIFYQNMDNRMTQLDQNMTEMRGEWSSFDQFVRGYMSQYPSSFPPPPPPEE